MRKHSIMTLLLSILTLAIFAGCNSSSSDSGFLPPIPPSDARVGTYEIISIKTVSYDTANIQQILTFNGIMVVKNDLSIEGKYQILGNAELANRPASQPKAKLVTYNKFSADNVTVANLQPISGTNKASLTVKDNAGATLELVVEQKDRILPFLGIDYQAWADNATNPNGSPIGNPYWVNYSFYAGQSRELIPTLLIGNYIVTAATIEKGGAAVNVATSLTEKQLVGELSVTAELLATGNVKLNIVFKMQVSPDKVAAIGSKTYFYEKLEDTIPLPGDFYQKMDFYLKQFFTDEGMDIVPATTAEADIKYSPKKRNTDGVTFSDFLVDGDTKIKLELTKISNGRLWASGNPAPERVLVNTKYWN